MTSSPGSNERPRVVGALLAVVVGATVVAALLVEGVGSLLWGRSVWLGEDRGAVVSRAQFDEERFAAAASNSGPYVMHPDPLVSYVLRPESELDVKTAHTRTDALGMRSRTGAPPAPDPVRIAVLGDSVAFGYGLSDEEALANRLEAVIAEVRGDADAPGVVCRSVALPGWNHRNMVHFLLDHLEELDPDHVVYVPIPNDVCNSDSVFETGHRRIVPDLAQRDPWTMRVGDQSLQFLQTIVRKARRGELGGAADHAGTSLLHADIGAESIARYDALADSVARLVERTGVPLTLVLYSEHPSQWLLLERLHRRGVPFTAVPTLKKVTAGDTLGYDPHPNATTVAAMATWIAESLFAQGLDAGAGRPLPDVPGDITERRAYRRGPRRIAQLTAEHRAEQRAKLEPVWDVETLRGIFQVYGGLEHDGVAAISVLVGVAPEGREVEVVLEPLEGLHRFYPLTVDVEFDGIDAGSVVVPERGRGSARFPVPGATADVLEVRLVPRRWDVDVLDGTSRVVSFRPVRVACVDG